MPSEGKSGSFFFFTHDNKFIIKTISDNEKETFLDDFSENYYKHVTEKSTLLCRIYGIYTLKIGFTVSVNLIMMENIMAIDSKIVKLNLIEIRNLCINLIWKVVNTLEKQRI